VIRAFPTDKPQMRELRSVSFHGRLLPVARHPFAICQRSIFNWFNWSKIGAPHMILAAGTRLGPYEILAPIGEGGMGVVFRARDRRLDRQVAIKVLPPALAADRQARERLRREAMAAAALDHPYICKIFEIGEEGDAVFLVMEYVGGETLDRRLRNGQVPLPETLRLAGEIAEALQEAHERGILHRDLKPSNIMLTQQGHVKVMDFGLARRLADLDRPDDATLDTASPQLTAPGTILGTPDYMSPEQVKGSPLDTRSDLFSFGVILAEMASARHPFRKQSTVETLSAVLRDPPDLNSDIPQGMKVLLRRLLAKSADDRYRSAADVRADLSGLAASSAAAVPDKVKAGASTAWRWLAVAGLAVFIALVAYLVSHFGWLHTAPRVPEAAVIPHAIRSIAVLPLDNYSGDPGQDYFAEGMTDELTTDLATISQLRVISRGSAMQFKGEHRPSTPQIAKALNVDAVVEGSVLRAGDKVRITAQLIDARADKHLWAKSFERSSGDVLALQDELARAIAHEIHVQLTATEQSRLGTAPTVDPEAHDAYLKGRYFFNRPSDENLKRAIAQFEEAVRLSPEFAPAFSGLSDAYLWAGYNEGVLTAAEAKPKAKAAAERAIQLDDTSAEAHTSLAVFKLFYEYDWAGCEREFRRAIALNPNYAFAHDQFGLALAFQGRLGEAVAQGKLASELDPLSPQIPIDDIFAFVWQGDYQGAREQAKRAADLDPAYFFPQMTYGWIDIEAGKIQDAIPALQKANAMESPAFVTAFLAYAYGASGDRARAMAGMEDLKRRSLHGHVLPFNLALAYIGLGDRERALDCLERAYSSDSQWMGWLKNDRIFDPLRSEPRFIALMKKLRFDNGT
jgi:eukaryotic-like serine/threonine-protein kinase